MDNIVYTFSGGDLLNNCFNAVAMITNNGSFLENIFKTFMVLGGIWMGAYIGLLRRWNLPIKWMLWSFLAFEVLLIPKTTVHIVDLMNKNPYTVDGIPVVLASIASVTSTIGKELTEGFEATFSLPDDFAYSKTGSVFHSRLTQKMSKARVTDPLFSRTLDSFVNQCVIMSSMANITFSPDDVINSNDLWGLVKSNAPKAVGFTFFQKGGSRNMSCHEGVKEIEKLWSSEISKISSVTSLGIERTELNKQLTSNYSLSGKLTNNIKAADLIRQEIMMNEVVSTNSTALSEYGSGGAIAIAKASMQQRSSWLMAGELFSQTMVQLKNVLEVLMIGSFCFLIFFVFLPNGYKYIFKYFQFMLALELWGPLNAILNMCMNIYTDHQSSSILGDSGLNILTSAAYHDLHSNTVAIAAWIQGLIPFLSYGLVQTGVTAIDGLAQNFASATQSSVGSSANDLISGNYQMDNLSFDNQNFSNTSGFQHNMSPSFNDGQYSSFMPDGTMRKITGNGNAVFVSQGQSSSQLETQISGQDLISSAIQTQLSHAESDSSILSQEYSRAESQSARQMYDLMNRALHGDNQAISILTSSGKQGSALYQKASGAVEDMQKSHGITRDLAADLAAGVSAGLGISIPSEKGNSSRGVSIGGNAGGSVRFGQGSHINDFISSSKAYNLHQSAEDFKRNSKDWNTSEMSSQEKSFADSLSQSFEVSDQKRLAFQSSLQNVDSLNRMHDDVKSGNLSISHDYTQEYLEYVSQQPIRGTNTPMGMDQAVSMLKSGHAGVYESQFADAKVEQIKAKYSNDGFRTEFGPVTQGNIGDVNHSSMPSTSDISNQISPGSIGQAIGHDQELIRSLEHGTENISSEVSKEVRNSEIRAAKAKEKTEGWFVKSLIDYDIDPKESN